MSTIDLTMGYWQILLATEDQDKMAFTTPSELYHFTKMPFGLHGEAVSFQREIGKALAPV